MAFSPQLDPDRIGEVALEYARWMLQVFCVRVRVRVRDEVSYSQVLAWPGAPCRALPCTAWCAALIFTFRR